MLPLLDDCLYAKNPKYCWTFSKDNDDQRIMQSDWTRGTTGHSQLKAVVSDTTFVDDYLHAKNSRQWLKTIGPPYVHALCSQPSELTTAISNCLCTSNQQQQNFPAVHIVVSVPIF